jgi:hypothetical protein
MRKLFAWEEIMIVKACFRTALRGGAIVAALAALGGGVAPLEAATIFSENFEAYAPGSNLIG